MTNAGDGSSGDTTEGHAQAATDETEPGNDRPRSEPDGGAAPREVNRERANDDLSTSGVSQPPGDTAQPTGDPGRRRLLRALGLVAVAGAFVFWTPFLFTGSGWILLTGPAIGGSIALLAALNVYRGAVDRDPSPAVSGLLVVLAIGAAASPILLAVDAVVVFWVTLLAGVIAAVLAAYVLVTGVRRRNRTARGP